MTISASQPVAALARIRARSDGEPVLWWWQGEVLGKRPGEIAKRLMRINGIGFNRLTRLPDGLWESRMSEAGYYIDAGYRRVSRQLDQSVHRPRGQHRRPIVCACAT